MSAHRPAARTVVPFVVTFAAFLALMASANLPTTLYAVYADRFGFSSLVLTLVFTTYMLVLAPSLLVFGQLSDRLGRRRVMIAGLLVAIVGLALFAGAQGTAWLFAARALQGVAVGAINGTATAALVEFEPEGDRARAALLAGLAQAAGSGLGAIAGGVLAEYAPHPQALCYLIWIAFLAVAAVAILRLPEPARTTGRWVIQRPSVPREIRAAFARASLTAGAVWAVAALFLSVVPSYAASLLDTGNLATLGAIGALALAASCLGQAIAVRLHVSRSLEPLGLALLIAGLVLLVLAFPAGSLLLILGSALLVGLGHGIGFLAAQTDINHLAPPERRGEVTAAFVMCVYLCVAVPVISVGVLTEVLTLEASVRVFAIMVSLAAAGAAVWHVRAARVAR